MREDALQLLSVLDARLWSGVPSAPFQAATAPAAEAPSKPGAASGEEPAIVVGGIQDTYRHLQLQLSDKLARCARRSCLPMAAMDAEPLSSMRVGGRREHPELSETLCVEVMLRQLDSASAQALRHQVLTCLAPWMRNLTFAPRWEGAPRSPVNSHAVRQPSNAYKLQTSTTPGAQAAGASSCCATCGT